MVEQGKRARRGWHQRYLGARVNCESAPCLPAGAVAWILDDPRHLPYLMVWKDQRSEKLVEAVRVCAYSRSDSLDWTSWVEVKRKDAVGRAFCVRDAIVDRVRCLSIGNNIVDQS